MTVGVVADLVRAALGDLAAEVQHHDVVGDRHHHGHVVLDQQHRQVELVADLADGLRRARRPRRGSARWPARRAAAAAASPARARANSMRLSVPNGRPGSRPIGEIGRGRAGRGSTGSSARSRALLAARRRSAAAARTKPTWPLAVGAGHHVLEHGQRREQRQVLERAGDAERRDLDAAAAPSRSWPSKVIRPCVGLVEAAQAR